MKDLSGVDRRDPPRQARPLAARRLLVIAPHPDDESLGAGGLIVQTVESGGEVRLLVLTDGEAGDFGGSEESPLYRQRRRREAVEAAALLGAGSVEFAGLPDGRLAERLPELTARLASELAAFAPDLIAVPSGWELHADHRAAAAAALRAVQEWAPPIEGGARLAFFEITVPLSPNWLVDITAQRQRKERAVAAYASQLAVRDYAGAARALNRFRALTLPPECEAAEAYLVLGAEAARTLDPLVLWDEERAARPLAVSPGAPVSIVVRTRNRPHLLAEALASLKRQSHAALEVIVVNDAGESVRRLVRDTLGALDHQVLEYEERQGRAEALNRGIEAASGSWVGILDDDDLYYPDHVETLATALAAGGHGVAYSDAAVGVYELDASGRRQLRERRLPYAQDFDADLLLFDNYIPLNTLLFERALFAETGPFDRAFDLFEDWDFLIRLSRRSPFLHVRRTTCEYRQIPDPGAPSIVAGAPRGSAEFAQARRAVYAKHRALRGVEAQARVFDRMRQLEVAQREELKSLRAEAARIAGDLSVAGVGARQLADRYSATEAEFHRANGERQTLRQELDRRTAEMAGAAAVAEEGKRAALAQYHQANGERVALAGELGQVKAALVEHGERLQGSYAAYEELLAVARQALARAEGAEAELVSLHVLRDEVAAAYAESGRLNARLEGMERHRVWRLYRRWQRWRGRLTEPVND